MSDTAFLMAFDRVVEGCRAVLASVPDDRIDWRPHEKSWTLGKLGSHIANLPQWTLPTLAESTFNIDPEGDPPPMAEYASSARLVEALNTNAAAARGAIERASEEDFQAPWSLLVRGETRFSLPKRAVLRGFILDHMIHHRAQMGVYLRLLDVPVPPTMGPTADFPDM